MLEIRAGTGGSEANINDTTEGWKVSMMDSSPGDNCGYKNVVLKIKGDSVYSKLKWEAGVVGKPLFTKHPASPVHLHVPISTIDFLLKLTPACSHKHLNR